MNGKYYGEFGGQYVSESLMNTLNELDRAYEEAIQDSGFWREFHYYMKEYVGRETPLYFAEKFSEKYGTKVYLKREDLNHTGAHKINNVIGQILLAKRMGKKGHCRNRRRAAWRGNRNRRCSVWDGVPGLYGQGRCKTAGIECASYGNAWGRGNPCGVGELHIKRCNK